MAENSTGGIVRRGFLGLLGGAAVALGIEGFLSASASPQRAAPQIDDAGRRIDPRLLEGSRVKQQESILFMMVTILMRVSMKSGDKFADVLPLHEAFNHPLNDLTPAWLAQDAWVERRFPGVRITPTSRVYQVAPGWLVVHDLSPDHSTNTLMVVDWSSPESLIHPCARVFISPTDPGPTEGTCEGLDWTTHSGVPMSIRRSNERKKQPVGFFAAISAFFVPTIHADEGDCGSSDTCGCQDNCWPEPHSYCEDQHVNCYFGCPQVRMCCCIHDCNDCFIIE